MENTLLGIIKFPQVGFGNDFVGRVATEVMCKANGGQIIFVDGRLAVSCCNEVAEIQIIFEENTGSSFPQQIFIVGEDGIIYVDKMQLSMLKMMRFELLIDARIRDAVEVCLPCPHKPSCEIFKNMMAMAKELEVAIESSFHLNMQTEEHECNCDGNCGDACKCRPAGCHRNNL